MAKGKKKLDKTIREVVEQEPPKPYGVCYDKNGLYIGEYVYIDHRDQHLLKELFQSWIDTYNNDENFCLTLDLETQGLVCQTDQILLVSIAWADDKAVVFSPYHLWGRTDSTGEGEIYELFLEILGLINLDNQNLKFDCEFLYEKYKIEPNYNFCTLTAAPLGYAGAFPFRQFDLGTLVKVCLQPYELNKESQLTFVGQPVKQQCTDTQVEYSAADTMIVRRLKKPLMNRLINNNLLHIYDIEKWANKSLVLSEHTGILTDKEKLAEQYEYWLTYTKDIEAKLQTMYLDMPEEIRPRVTNGTFNPLSWQHIKAVLNARGIKIKTTAQEDIEEARIHQEDPFLDLLIQHKETYTRYVKLFDKWLAECVNPVTGAIHPSYKSCAADTGRLTSSPNMQNIAPEGRPILVAREGYDFINVDYSSYEFRSVAAQTMEQSLIDIFHERAELMDSMYELCQKYPYIDEDSGESGLYDPDSLVKALTKNKVDVTLGEREHILLFGTKDIHRRNASLMLNIDINDVTGEQRSIGKTLGYAILYGSGPGRMMITLLKEGVTNITVQQCKHYSELFRKALPKVDEFIKDTHKQVLNPGYCTTPMGRKRFFKLCPKYMPERYRMELVEAQRGSVNFRAQGSNADGLKLAMGYMYKEFKPVYGLTDMPQTLLNIHDEVLVESRQEFTAKVAPVVVSCMVRGGSEAIEYKCPIETSLSITRRFGK
jgi:DNA polymerase I-like protein with 3'-5' exonuclease and polymerase domains